VTATFDDILGARAAAAGSRRSALMLHALPATDREWVLAHLSESQRQALEAMLGELRDLNIPPDAAARLYAPRSSSAAAEGRGRGMTPRTRVGRAAALTCALGGEPPLLVDVALALEDHALRREVSVALSRPVQACAVVPDRLARSLQRHLEERLAHQADAPAPQLGIWGWRSLVAPAWQRMGGIGGRLADACLGRSRMSSVAKDTVTPR